MGADPVFRMILLIGLGVVMPVGIYHRLKAHGQGDVISRREEGWFILLTLRPVGIAGMIGLLLYVIHPPWMAWSALPLPAGVRWVGVGLGAGGAALFIATLRALGTNLTDTVVTRANHTLVTSGPYRWVRHPFYVACALAVTANALVAANWFIGAAGLTATVLLGIRTPTEERNLQLRFGEDYARYRARTGRFLPRRASERKSSDLQ